MEVDDIDYKDVGPPPKINLSNKKSESDLFDNDEFKETVDEVKTEEKTTTINGDILDTGAGSGSDVGGPPPLSSVPSDPGFKELEQKSTNIEIKEDISSTPRNGTKLDSISSQPEKNDTVNINGHTETEQKDSETTTATENESNSLNSKQTTNSRKRSRPDASPSSVIDDKSTTQKETVELTSNDKEFFFEFIAEYFSALELRPLSLVSKKVLLAISKSIVWGSGFMRCKKTLRGHLNSVTSLANVHTWVFSGSLDGKVKVWDVANWRCVRTLCMNQLQIFPQQQVPYSNYQFVREVYDVTAVEAGAHFVFFGMANGFIAKQLLFRQTQQSGSKAGGNNVKPLKAHRGKVNCLKLVENRLFSGGLDSRIVIVDTETLHTLHYVKIHTRPINCFAAAHAYPSQFTGTELRLFSAGDDGNILSFNLTRFRIESPLIALPEEAREFRERMQKMGPGADGQNTPIQMHIKLNLSHGDKVTCMTIHSNQKDPTNGRLVTCSWDCTIKMWDINKLELLKEVFLTPLSICWDISVRKVKDFAHLVCSVRDGELEFRSLTDLFLLPGIIDPAKEHFKGNWSKNPSGHSEAINQLFCFPDGKIVTASKDWSMKVWEIRGLPLQPEEPSVKSEADNSKEKGEKKAGVDEEGKTKRLKEDVKDSQETAKEVKMKLEPGQLMSEHNPNDAIEESNSN